MTNKTAKLIYVIWQTAFGVPALYLIDTMIQQATDNIHTRGEEPLTLVFVLLILFVAALPSNWYLNRNDKRGEA